MGDREPRGWLLIAAGCLGGSMLSLGGLVPWLAEVLIRAGLVLVATGTLIKCIYPWHRNRLERGPDTPFMSHTVPEDNVRGLKRRAGSSAFSQAEAAKIFALAVVKPTELRQRVVDTYTPDRRTISHRVSIDCQIPSSYMGLVSHDADAGTKEDDGVTRTPKSQNSAPPLVYFPLLMPRKGRLQDEFDALSGDGTSLSVLSYREYLQLAACTLRALLLLAFRSASFGVLPREVQDAEKACLFVMMKRAEPPHAGTPGVAQLMNALDAIATIPTVRSKIQDAKAFEMAISFVKKLSNNYAIVAVVQPTPSGRFLVKYEQTIIPDLKLTSSSAGFFGKAVGWLRVALGARPVDVTISIDNACTAQSYHLRFSGSEGMYLMGQSEIDFAKTVAVKAKGAPMLAHLRFRKRLGQPHAHFYARYFPESYPGERPRLRFSFGEVPPGSLLRAAITALAGLALVWLVGVINSDKVDPGTDAPAFLLSFPALAATWLGFETPSRRLLEGTLRARFSLILTAVQSLAAAGLFMAHKAFGTDVKWLKLPGNVSILGVEDVAWVAILSIAIVNAAYTCYKYWLHTNQYAFYSTRVGGSGVDQNG